MGTEHSKLKGIEIEKKSVEITDFWSLYNAEISNEDNVTPLSIFQEEPIVRGQLWMAQSPLERAIKNLMIYRHPSILKFFTSWEQGSQKYLATERIQPLSLVLQTLNDVQICLGLRNILCSLIFLLDQAKVRHLNICISSIYLNNEGHWHLGGFEYVWKAKEVTKDLLGAAQNYRHKAAIDPNEMSLCGEGLEQYSFATLCEEILKNSKNSDTPYVNEFREYCDKHLKHQNVAMRPKLSAVLLHPYFNHEFILIYSFLSELPLKSPQEKQEFFTGLADRLRYFNESIVASQLGNLLLSRMVLLDATAQLCVMPYILKTKNDFSAALFTNHTFIKYIIPKIRQIFYVRDIQIRLILLEYFENYIKLLTKEEITDQILPNLLLGIKDTNDVLVAKTLRCLADLIPILGSTVVIGGHRSKIFADGRPQTMSDSARHWMEPRSITPVIASDELVSASPILENVDVSESYVSVVENTIMPERLSPDGGEDIQAATDIDVDEDAWSDWENDENHPEIDNTSLNAISTLGLVNIPGNNIEVVPNAQVESPKKSKQSSKLFDDINELDIKVQKVSLSTTEEIDFFKDMEPVIQVSNVVMTAQEEGILKDDNVVDKSRFEFKATGETDEIGWDDGSNGWGE